MRKHWSALVLLTSGITASRRAPACQSPPAIRVTAPVSPPAAPGLFGRASYWVELTKQK